jgi:hypothetical protein
MHTFDPIAVWIAGVFGISMLCIAEFIFLWDARRIYDEDKPRFYASWKYQYAELFNTFKNPLDPYLAGLNIPLDMLRTGGLFVGVSGTGKTSLIKMFVGTLMNYITAAANSQRMIVLDSKNEVYGFLDKILPLHMAIYRLNPRNLHGCFWDMAKDFHNRLELHTLTNMLIPDDGTPDKFWPSNARNVLWGAIVALQNLVGNEWRLHDLISIILDKKLLTALLTNDPETVEIASILDKKVGDSVYKTLQSHMLKYREIAAAWAQSDMPFVAKDFMQDSGVVLLDYDHSIADGITPIYALLVETLTTYGLSRPDGGETWGILDEIAVLPPVGAFEKIAQLGRSANIRMFIGYQDNSSLTDRRKYGRDGFNKIYANLGFKVFLRVGCADTARYISEGLGHQAVGEHGTSHQYLHCPDADGEENVLEGHAFHIDIGVYHFQTPFVQVLNYLEATKADQNYIYRHDSSLKLPPIDPGLLAAINKQNPTLSSNNPPKGTP